MLKIEGKFNAKGLKFVIIVSRFNEAISSKLYEGALDSLKRHDADEKDITAVFVPGAFEIPLVAKLMAESKKYDAVICLGAIIRGDTPHFEYVAAESVKGIASASVKSTVPVILGVITVDNIDQALERAGLKNGNKGWQAATDAIEMANLLKILK